MNEFIKRGPNPEAVDAFHKKMVERDLAAAQARSEPGLSEKAKKLAQALGEQDKRNNRPLTQPTKETLLRTRAQRQAIEDLTLANDQHQEDIQNEHARELNRRTDEMAKADLAAEKNLEPLRRLENQKHRKIMEKAETAAARRNQLAPESTRVMTRKAVEAFHDQQPDIDGDALPSADEEIALAGEAGNEAVMLNPGELDVHAEMPLTLDPASKQESFMRLVSAKMEALQRRGEAGHTYTLAEKRQHLADMIADRDARLADKRAEQEPGDKKETA